MTMKSLDNKEMIQLSTALLTPGTRQHEAATAVPSSSAFLPVMQASHDELVRVVAGVDTEALAASVHTLVDQHDALASGIGLRLDAEIAMANVDADVGALTQARDQIFPPGESLLKSSVSAKGGEYVVRAVRVTPASLAVLGTIPMRGGGTLADRYAQLQTTSQELGAACARRQGASAEQAGPRVRDARKRWVAAVELIDLSMTAAGADTTPVLGAIRAAQASAVPATVASTEPSPATGTTAAEATAPAATAPTAPAPHAPTPTNGAGVHS
jgi:hypothetical protein